jgi:holliday junction DNA helicase RuvA
MIALIEGKVVALEADSAILLVSGVGYEVFCSKRCLENISVNSTISLHIYTEVKEDTLRLYGFSELFEKKVFLLLLKVSGVGPKGALVILSQTTGDILFSQILSNDVTSISKLKGIGLKKAEKIIVELKERVSSIYNEFSENNMFSHYSSRSNSLNQNVIEAKAALEALGFNEATARVALDKALEIFEGQKVANGTTSYNISDLSSSELVKSALLNIS